MFQAGHPRHHRSFRIGREGDAWSLGCGCGLAGGGALAGNPEYLGNYLDSPVFGDPVSATAMAVTATATAVDTGLKVDQANKEFERANLCIMEYEKKGRYYQAKQWATPIFTPERVAYEKKANAYFQKAADARRTGCPKKKAVKSSSSSSAKAAPAFQPAAAPAAEEMSMTTKIGIAFLVVALFGGAAAYAKQQRVV